ncbi:MAG: alpha/beta hydrolase, partial [Acidobacteria bacterium]|nr:alpha/beta hydrolase [Acidobacteriota bacterium]
KGSPAVVIDTGIGDTMQNLVSITQRLAQTTRVFTYNRAGYGASEAGPLPRDAGREAEELKQLLGKAGVPGPYLLVGHSLGGLNVQVFAGKFPEDVAGIVLLDPPPLSFIQKQKYPQLADLAERMTGEWQSAADAGAGSADPEQLRQSSFLRMLASEHREMFGKSARLAAGIKSFGDIPLVLIASGKPNPAFGEIAGEYQEYWIDETSSLASRSSNSRFVYVEQSSHNLFGDAPDRMVSIVLSLLGELQGKKPEN